MQQENVMGLFVQAGEMEMKIGLFVWQAPLFYPSMPQDFLPTFLWSSSGFVGKILTRHFPDINPRLVFNLSKIISQICVRQSRDLNLIADVCLQIGQKLDAQAVSKEFSGEKCKIEIFLCQGGGGSFVSFKTSFSSKKLLS